MPFYRSSPWADAGAYGEGLGNTLAQALIQMPQQRVQNAMQLRQMQLQQQQEAVRNALQQRQQSAEQQLGLSELALKQQELRQQEEFHKAEVAAAMQRAQNEAKGTWKIGQTKEGKPYKINSLTGAHEWLQEPSGVVGATGPMPTGLGGLSVPLPTGQMQAYATTLGDVGKFINGGTQSNAPSVFNAATNAVPQLIQRIIGAQQQAGGLGALMPTMPQQTNVTPKVLRYNPTTGTLE